MTAIIKACIIMLPVLDSDMFTHDSLYGFDFSLQWIYLQKKIVPSEDTISFNQIKNWQIFTDCLLAK